MGVENLDDRGEGDLVANGIGDQRHAVGVRGRDAKGFVVGGAAGDDRGLRHGSGPDRKLG